jgi:hypothetical protein
MTGINLVNYENLSKYGILARTAITNTGSTTINNGYWFAPTIDGANDLTAGSSPSGLNNTLSTSALSELNTLIADITTYTNSLTTINIGAGGGNTTFLPNRSYKGTGITFSSETLTFDAQNNANAQFFITDLGAFTFTSVTFELINGAQSCNIFWLSNPPTGAGGFTVTTPATMVPGIIITNSNGSTSSVTFTNTSQNISGHIYSNTSVTITSTGLVNVNSNTCPIVCYAKGTLILTKKGFMPIENITTEDKVITKGKIYKNKYIKEEDIHVEPISWISKFKVHDLNSKSRPICIKKDALGKNSPFQDLYVSPGHSLLLNNKMVLAKRLVNGVTVYQDEKCDSVEYYHLECDYHSAIYANGVLSESYLDLKNRDVFEDSVREKINKRIQLQFLDSSQKRLR